MPVTTAPGYGPLVPFMSSKKQIEIPVDWSVREEFIPTLKEDLGGFEMSVEEVTADGNCEIERKVAWFHFHSKTCRSLEMSENEVLCDGISS